MLRFECLDYSSKSREGLVDVLRFGKSSLVNFAVQFLAACQVHERELRDKMRLLIQLLSELDVLLTVLAAAHIRHHRLVEFVPCLTLFGIELDDEDGVTSRALYVLGSLMHLPPTQRLLHYGKAILVSAKASFLYILDDEARAIAGCVQLLDLWLLCFQGVHADPIQSCLWVAQ